MHKLLSSILISCLVLLTISDLKAQNKFTISGYVKDASTGETMIGANVYLKETQKGTTTNVYGFYSFTVESGTYTLVATYLGYVEEEQKVNLNQNLQVAIAIKPKVVETQAAEVVGSKVENKISSTQMGKEVLEIETIKSIPAFLGEV
ncbi:MAG TPA: carboxypeptidase-like regulatory domain-containing protein, partial [Bacteroidia bacterium]|nr:carboxypeptidase-like regulatory domain-containing protein [Bacteroidia bacterium]